MKTLDFRYSPFFENIAILGMQGQGKTSKVRDILDTVPNIPRFIWSPQEPLKNYGDYGYEVNSLSRVGYGFSVWTGNFTKDTFRKIAFKIFTECRNMLFIVDDVHEQCTKQSIPPELEYFISSGRNRGLSGIYISPFPNRVSNVILGSCQHMFSFPFTLQNQIEWMRDNFFGVDAWLLLPKTQRARGMFDSEKDYDVLPRHSYIYRKNTDSQNQIMIKGVDF